MYNRFIDINIAWKKYMAIFFVAKIGERIITSDVIEFGILYFIRKALPNNQNHDNISSVNPCTLDN